MRKKFELGGLTKAQKTLPKKLQDRNCKLDNFLDLISLKS